MTLEHLVSLDSGLVKYEYYNSVADIARAAASKLGPGIPLLYIGYKGIAAEYTINLGGVPKGVEMDAIQQRYFNAITTTFLDEGAYDDYATVFHITVDEQSSVERRLRGYAFIRYLHSTDVELGSIKLKGMILGAQLASLSNENFDVSIESSFMLGEDDYVSTLKMKTHLPAAIVEGAGLDFFKEAYAVICTVEVAEDDYAP